MTSYPIPVVKGVTYLGNNKTSDGYPVKSDTVFVELSASPLAPAVITCNIRVVNLIHSDVGFYRIQFGNSLGELLLTLSISGKYKLFTRNNQFRPLVSKKLLSACFLRLYLEK